MTAEKKQNVTIGLATMIGLTIIAVIALYLLVGTRQSSFIPSPGFEMFLPFLAVGLLVGIIVLFLTPKGNWILALAAQILVSCGSFFGVAQFETSQRNAEITQQARAEQKQCQDAYDKNKDLFKVSNFNAEPVKDPQTGKVTAMKVRFESNLSQEAINSVQISGSTIDNQTAFVTESGTKANEDQSAFTTNSTEKGVVSKILKLQETASKTSAVEQVEGSKKLRFAIGLDIRAAIKDSS